MESLCRAAGKGPASPHSVRVATQPDTKDMGTDLREQSLAAQLGARIVLPGLLYIEEILDARYRHGGRSLGSIEGIGPDPLGVAFPPPDGGWFFFDTETTGLAGGTGTLVFLFGGVQIEPGRYRLRQWLLTRFSGEEALMAAVREIFGASSGLVSFNGKSFDLPLLRARQRLHHAQLPEQHLTHLDLLHPARSAFAGRWPDVRLQTAERRLCEYQRCDDLPGSEAPLAFTRWLREGSGTNLIRVVRHHRDDVLSLVTLCSALVETFQDPARHAANEDGILRRMQRRGYRFRSGQAQLALVP